jgi:hypothetical protein
MTTNAIISLAIGTVLCIVIQRALAEASMFSRGVCWLLSFCVTSLCLIGLIRHVDPVLRPEAPQDHPASPSISPMLDVLLLPYAALALAMLVLLILGFLRRCWQRAETRDQLPSSPSRWNQAQLRGHSVSRGTTDKSQCSITTVEESSDTSRYAPSKGKLSP